MHYPNGSKFVGDFKDNLRHGRGAFTTSKGVIYDGEWNRDRFEGTGSIRSEDRIGCSWRKYIGEFKNWKRHGEGRQYYHEGVYDGQWADGLRNGLGIMQFTNGNLYVGSWKDDKYHGIGTMVYGKSLP